jgi:hypothetical protein
MSGSLQRVKNNCNNITGKQIRNEVVKMWKESQKNRKRIGKIDKQLALNRLIRKINYEQNLIFAREFLEENQQYNCNI